jgi:lipid-A-disaccharide synthase-like uncharacterized protein
MSNIKFYLSKSAIEAHSMQWKKNCQKFFSSFWCLSILLDAAICFLYALLREDWGDLACLAMQMGVTSWITG